MEPRTSYTQPGHSRTSYPSYHHQEYHQEYFTQAADSRRAAVSRPIESPPAYSPESNYSEYSDIVNTYFNN